MKVTFLEKNLKHIIFVISVFFIGIGILREEQLVVLNKAVNICLECIGVG